MGFLVNHRNPDLGVEMRAEGEVVASPLLGRLDWVLAASGDGASVEE